MTNDVKWFEYVIDRAQILTPIENVEELRLCSSNGIPFTVVKVTIRTREARLIFSKEYSSEEKARNVYNYIHNALEYGERLVPLEDWEFEALWEEK